MTQIDRLNGQNYADNIIDPILSFDSGTWTVVSGTGSATLDFDNPYFGKSSLKIENNEPLNKIFVSNAIQNTIIPYSGKYILSFFVKKNIPLEVRTGAVLIYKNAVLLATENFDLGSETAENDIDNVWIRFQTQQYDFIVEDTITFQFRLDDVTTSEISTIIWIDGVMLNATERQDFIVPQFVPNNQVKVPALPTADGNYQLTISGGVATWNEII